jgi:hypothetical protein
VLKGRSRSGLLLRDWRRERSLDTLDGPSRSQALCPGFSQIRSKSWSGQEAGAIEGSADERVTKFQLRTLTWARF